MYVRDILSRPVVTVGPETPLPEAISLLTEHHFAALPVVDDADRVIGMLSESDALAAASAVPAPAVGAVMSSPVEVAEPHSDVTEVAARMLDRHLRSMPVVEEGVLVGIVARRDLLAVLLHDSAELEAKIRALLDDYAGSRREWTIEVHGSRARIRGHFADAAERHTVVSLALTVDGIDRVDTADPEGEFRVGPLVERLRRRADEAIG
ncbi:CBS domain-containing protein [Nocardia stercoris]|uniref:CBS domain-containing protein n=1 Tax=Nocardia stercoris TaxID=2483361 RepID=A0A3M2LC59_9NOCA|nr:CBS domain-containing protein [Nocardia stercoris]RMI33555.1 CBS domain-containing protein [Nocardia stercoris]